MDRELEWNDTIQNDSEFTLLPEGKYPFEVLSFERGRHSGSAKLPPCNMAVLKISVGDEEHGTTVCTHRLYLHTKTEGMLCQFFVGIGARSHGESVTMDWNGVPGSTGTCQVGQHEYDGKTYNEIKKFLEPETNKTQTEQKEVIPF